MTVLRERFEEHMDGTLKLTACVMKESILDEIKNIRFPHFYAGTADPYEIKKHPELVRPMGKKAIVIKKSGIRIDNLDGSNDNLNNNNGFDLEDRVYLLPNGLYTFKMNVFNVKSRGRWGSGYYPIFESKEEKLKNYIIYLENIVQGIKDHRNG